MSAIRSPCGRDCLQRKPGCHDPDTCSRWREYIAVKADYDAHVSARRKAEEIMQQYKNNILRASVRRTHKRGER